MNALSSIPDRDPVAAARRVTIDDAAKAALEREYNQTFADIRDAAILNTILLAKSHGATRDITAEDVARWRRIRAEVDATVIGGEGEVIPAGFGPAVRTQHAARLVQAAVRAGAAAPRSDGDEG